MTTEPGSFDRELMQLREGLTTQISTLSERLTSPAPQQSSLFSQAWDKAENVIQRLHIPFYKDRKTRARLELAKAQERLEIIQEIDSLNITDRGNDGWRAWLQLSTVDETNQPDWVSIVYEKNDEPVKSRSGRLYTFSYRAKSSIPIIALDPTYVLVETYGWVIDGVRKQHNQNLQAERDAQRTRTISE